MEKKTITIRLGGVGIELNFWGFTHPIKPTCLRNSETASSDGKKGKHKHQMRSQEKIQVGNTWIYSILSIT